MPQLQEVPMLITSNGWYRLCKFIVLVGFFLSLCTSSHVSSALEPPRTGEGESLKANRDLTERLTFARQLSNHKIDPFLLRQAITRTARNVLQTQARFAAETEAISPVFEPTP